MYCVVLEPYRYQTLINLFSVGGGDLGIDLVVLEFLLHGLRGQPDVPTAQNGIVSSFCCVVR